MADRLDKGYFGEQGAGFFFGSEGYFVVDGPSGAGGHAANAKGFDGIAFNPNTGFLIYMTTRRLRPTAMWETAIDPAVP